MEKLKCTSCLRFEELLDKWETEALTDDEVDFVLDREDNCPTGLRTFEAVEKAYGLPDGSLRNWNGRDPLPRPDERDLEARARAQDNCGYHNRWLKRGLKRSAWPEIFFCDRK